MKINKISVKVLVREITKFITNDLSLGACINRYQSNSFYYQKYYFFLFPFILQERFTDVTITCEGKFYPVHKLVLSTCSDYFQKIFECTPCKHPVIVLKDIHCKDIEALLSYMYAGVVSVAQKDLSQLIKAAELLQIKGLAVPDEPPQYSRRMFAAMEDVCDSDTKRQKRHDSMNGENELTVVGGVQMSPDGSSSHKDGEHFGSSGQRAGHRLDHNNQGDHSARDNGDKNGDDNDDDRASQALEQSMDDDVCGQDLCAQVEVGKSLCINSVI